MAFSEIMFCPEYYIDGVNVFDDENRVHLGKVDIDLRLRVSYSKLDNVDVYQVKGKHVSVKICISKVKDFYIISYYDSKEFYKVARFRRELLSSSKKNRELLENIAIKQSKEKDNPNIMYSSNNKRRVYIENKDDIIMVYHQYLEVRDYMSYHFREDISSSNYWNWELGVGVSYYASIDDAKAASKDWISEKYDEPEYEDVSYLWAEELGKKESILQHLKYAYIGLAIFTIPWIFFPLFGLSKWGLMLLIGMIDVMSIVIAFLALYFQNNNVSYHITDKSIIIIMGVEKEIPFDNIESFDLIKKKNKGTIKFKLKKGLSKSAKFINVVDYETAYKILKEKVH